VRITALETGEALQAFEGIWRQAYRESRTDNVFLSWEWSWLWWKHYGAEHRLRILVAEDARGVAGIAPLLMSPGGPATRWRPVLHCIGDEKLADYTDFLIIREASAVVKAILGTLFTRRDWGLFELRRTPETSPAFQPLCAALHRQNTGGTCEIECASPYLDVSGGWHEYLATRSKSLRQELRTSANRLRALGDTRFEVCQGEALAEARKALYAFHIQRQGHRPGRSIFEDARGRAFIDELTELTSDGLAADVSVIRVGDRPVSTVLTLRGRRTLYYWVPSFDSQIRSASLGKLHLRHLIECAFAEKHAMVDLMIGEDGYKLDWSNGVQQNWRVVFYGDSATGWVNRTVSGSKAMLRKVKARSRVLRKLWTYLSKIQSQPE